MTYNPDDGPKLTSSSVEDVRALAEHLWNHPELQPIFKRAGFRGDWSEGDQAWIDEIIEIYAKDVLGSGYFRSLNDTAQVRRKSKDYLKGLRDPLLLQLAGVVCRFVAGDRLSSPKGGEAYEFIEDRFFSRASLYSGLRTKKATVEDVLTVARDLRDNPVFWKAVEDAGDGSIDAKLWAGTLKPINDRIEAKYGLTNRGRIGALHVLRKLATGKILDIEDAAAREFVTKFSFVRGDLSNG